MKSVVKKHNKKGALEISFGMIFSIILVIVFLAFAFFGIKKLLGVQETALVGQFKYDLQNDINKMWNGPQGNQTMEYNLPKKIEQVCFRKSGSDNLYFEPRDAGFLEGKINHIDFDKTLSGKTTPKCFINTDGKVSITLKKDFGDSLVTLE